MVVIKEDLATIKANLSEHMRRTELAEESIKVLEKSIYQAQGAILLIGLLSTVASIVVIFLK